MTSIIIYTTGDKLLHKQGKLPDDDDFSEEGRYYWHLSRTPKKLDENDKIYFAVKGYVRGYFKIEDIEEDDDGCDITFHSNSWIDILPQVEVTHFQGFKYVNEEYKVLLKDAEK